MKVLQIQIEIRTRNKMVLMEKLIQKIQIEIRTRIRNKMVKM